MQPEMTKTEFIKLVQGVGKIHENLLQIYAVKAARYPNDKNARVDTEKYAQMDAVAQDVSNRIIRLIHIHLPEIWETKF